MKTIPDWIHEILINVDNNEKLALVIRKIQDESVIDGYEAAFMDMKAFGEMRLRLHKAGYAQPPF